MKKIIIWMFITLVLISSSSFAEKGNRALVVIDMQQYFIDGSGFAREPANQEKTRQLFDAQVEAIEAAVRTDTPIIFIEYDPFGTTDERLKNAARGAKDVVYFLKNDDGMFSNQNSFRQELVDYLGEKKIETLIMTGANGGACVHESIIGALNRNLSVIAYDQAIADFNYRDFRYPYDQYYRDRIHFSCEDCTFRETSVLSEIFSDVNSNEDRKSVRDNSVDSPAIQEILKKMDEFRQFFDKMSPRTEGCEG